MRTRTLLQANAPVEKLQNELKGIYDIIFREIEPALQKLTCNTLLINSSGILRYLPFAALYDGNKYLVEKYQITNITGLDLIRLSQSKATKNYNLTNAVIFADPDGTLPAGKNEGEFVSKLFQNAKLYIGSNATLDEFEALLGNVNFIHLATHAVLDSNNPADSYVLFANGKKWKYSEMMGFHARSSIDEYHLFLKFPSKHIHKSFLHHYQNHCELLSPLDNCKLQCAGREKFYTQCDFVNQ